MKTYVERILPQRAARLAGMPLVLLVLLGSAALVSMTGCAATHPRTSEDLATALARPKRVAILTPELGLTIKYISTPEFFRHKKAEVEGETWLADGLRRALASQGFTPVSPAELARGLPASATAVAKFQAEALAATQSLIETDHDYELEVIAPGAATCVTPRELAKVADLVVVTSGSLKQETRKQFLLRWFANIGLNLLTLPISMVSSFIPIAMPISVNISTSIFEGSPEEAFFLLGVVDCASGRVVYFNDYHKKWAPHDAEDFLSVAETLFEDLPPDVKPAPKDARPAAAKKPVIAQRAAPASGAQDAPR